MNFWFLEKLFAGNFVFGKKGVLVMNYYTLGISKINVLSVFEILSVETLVHTLRLFFQLFLKLLTNQIKSRSFSVRLE